MHSRRRGLFRFSSESPSDDNQLSRSIVAEPTKRELLETTSFDIFNTEEQWRPPTPVPVEWTIETKPELETPNTEDTQESYQTSPEISLAAQNLFEALLGKKPTDPEQDMAEGRKQTDVEMKDATRKVAEMKLSPPKAFTGKRDGLEEFVQNVQLYLDINEETYDTDKKKIGYMLSFMDDGDAKSWRAAFL